MKILRTEERWSRRGPGEWFDGQVWIEEVVTTPVKMKAARVSFDPGARTAWHTHPLGQALHVLHGVGRVQLEGGPVQEIRAGDTVWIEPGENHWHGASENFPMTHLAMQLANDEGVEVVWGEKVS